MNQQITAEVFADQIEVRFPFSGFITKVYKKVGDTVKAGELLASLDAKLLQTELDKELADYAKVRANFEIFDREHPNITDDTTRFLKTIVQANLTSSVKSVELAKARLDQIHLHSPVNGLIISTGGCRPGLFATPSSNSYMILDQDSMRLRTEIDPAQYPEISSRTFTAEISGNSLSLTPSPLLPDGKKYFVYFYLPANITLSPGYTFILQSHTS